MANLTISVNEKLLRRAHIKAMEEGTSVEVVLRHYLEAYAGPQRTQRALASFAELADRFEASSSPAGRSWTRDVIHDRRSPR